MLIGLKIFIFGVCIYAGIRLCMIATEWLSIWFDKIKPRKW